MKLPNYLVFIRNLFYLDFESSTFHAENIVFATKSKADSYMLRFEKEKQKDMHEIGQMQFKSYILLRFSYVGYKLIRYYPYVLELIFQFMWIQIIEYEQFVDMNTDINMVSIL